MKIINAKLLHIAPTVGVILFIGSILLSFVKGDPDFIVILLLLSYIIFGVIFYLSKKPIWAMVFFLLMISVPMVDFYFAGKIDANGILLDKNNQNIFNMYGNFGRSVLSMIIPVFVFIFRVKRLFESY